MLTYGETVKTAKKILICIFLFAVLVVSTTACKFNAVEDVDLSFYDGATLISSTTLFKYQQEPFVPEQKEGFYFEGWYLDMDCTKKADFDKIDKDTILYAGWKKISSGNSYKVSFFTQNDEPIGEQTVYSLNDIVYPEAPQIDGYAFVGWSSLPERLDSDFTIYALYSKEYTVMFFIDKSDSVPLSKQTVLEGQSAIQPEKPQKKGNDQYYYEFSHWDKKFDNVKSDLSIYAVFTRLTHKYTYTFKNYDGKILLSKNAYYGSQITPPVATKPDDDTFTYIFSGWDVNGDGKSDALPENLSYDFEAVALYTQTLKSLTVNFYSDELFLYSVSVTYGDDAEYMGKTPERASTKAYDYTFKGWDKSLQNITVNTDVFAEFDEHIRSYSYKFVDYTGIVSEDTAEYGTVIVCPTASEKPQDAVYSYVFDGWQGYSNGMILEEDVTFEASYKQTKRKYTYTFYYGKNIVLRAEAEYGTKIVAPEPPESADGSVFVRWIGFSNGMILEKDISFYALYE